MFAVPREQVSRVHASSGTTGRPTVVGYTKADLDTWADVMARSIRAAGGRAGMVLHNAYGYGLFTGGLGAHYGAERLGCTVVPVSGGMTERQVQAHPGLPARRHHGDALVHARDRRGDAAAGHRPGVHLVAGRRVRCRTVDQRHASRDGATCSTCTPSTSTGCRR
ncbi:hypothetical protein GCM10025868_17610 [Angustibacter aerolatus]|uniref:AMP-dependent synthetase/ligase domain-containing protein n=1 Tax=Angustibacter aerolatus TaxID=1162965 RepID=A0ABQ6JIB5_9ACTN|nr:hypothetical protein [Angustibacter aerolatus]GMA86511.1 hypothetical protein GCM10025868_17610 [Angustibacter aerolatus]